MKFAMLLLILGCAMFALPLGYAAANGWSWYFAPVIVVGCVLIIGGVAEGTS